MKIAKLRCFGGSAAHPAPPSSDDDLGGRRLQNLLRRALALLLSLLVFGPALGNQTINGITIDEDLPQARRGVAYSYTIPVISGGTAPYSFSLSGPSTLPVRLTLSSTGLVSGVISCSVANGNHGQDVTVTDSSASPIAATFTGNKGLRINVTAGPAGTCVTLTIAPLVMPPMTAGTPFNQTVAASGGLGPYTYAVAGGALPVGVTLNVSTGQLSGTPTSAGAYSFTIVATDAADSTGSATFSGSVLGVIAIAPASLPAASIGVAYSQTVTASGGTGGFSYSISAGALPAGLTLNTSSGVISGTPTTAGPSSVTVRATDSGGASATRAYSITTFAALTVNPATLPGGTVGTAYSRTISATGGTAPYTFAVVSGSLPVGLALNATSGLISGTPTAAAPSSFTIRATASTGAVGTRAYTVTINPAIVVSPATLSGGTVGTPYSQTVTATGGTGSYTFSATGTLPAGLTLNATTGVISGTPPTAVTRTFTIRATDGNAAIGSRAYTVTIGAAIVVNPATLPGGTVGSAYSRTVSATGGTGTKIFSVSAGVLPAGLSLNPSTGVLSGTPTAAGSSGFTIRATDSIGAFGTRNYAVTINPGITVSPTSLPNGTSGSPYSQTISATGGTGTFTYSVSAGSLGGGLTLNASTGAISGTPTTAGVRNFTIRATDGNGTFGSRAYSVIINAAVAVGPATLANGTVGTPYSRTVSATGGSGSYMFTVSVGTLPAGLTLNATSGVISGTPTTAATSAFTIRATDSNGAFGSRNYSVTIAPAPVVVNPASLPGGAVGAAYSQVVSATGGTGTYTFSRSAGTLPAGLSLNATTGAITGTPTTAGTSNFTIRATASGGGSGTRAYTVTINAAIVVNPATLAGGTAGTAYSQSVTATGGAGGYAFSISSGALPAGLTLNATSGLISGTPISGVTSTFTIRATDVNGASGSRSYTVSIAPALITVAPASLPGGTAGVPYLQTVSATGGTGSFTYSVSAGALPAGLSLNASSGVISGTPTLAVPSSFTVRATDSGGNSGTRAYSVAITAPPIAINPATLPTATVASAYSKTVTATGGIGGFTYSISAGALPAGLTLNASSGVISGTPTLVGPSSFTVRATDSGGNSATRAYSVTTNSTIIVSPASLSSGTVAAPYSQAISATGGNGSYTYSVSAGVLPSGLTLNPTSGVLSGTPTGAAASSFTVTATDGNGSSGARAYNVTIAAGIAVNPATLPAAAVGTAYSQTVQATGGTGSYSYGITTGSLPAGLSLNAANGNISGTPTSAATGNFSVTATDGNGATGSRSYSLVVNGAMALNPPTLSNGTVGAAYSQMVGATGGNSIYTYSLSAGSLPAGLTLDTSTGAIAGMPTVAGSSSFTIGAVDGTSAAASRAYSVTVSPAIVLNPPAMPGAVVGDAYNFTISATGGNGVYSYSVSSGSLPAGLSLNAATGAITGTPTSSATSNFTVTVTDALGATASRAYVVEVAPAALVLESTTLGNGVVGTPYNQAIVVSGGVAPYAFAVASGVLPIGVALDSTTGALAGTPTVPGTYAFTVRVVDANGASATFAQSIIVEPRPDPSADPTVRGMVAAQVSAASRFGSAQIENIGTRVRMLHFGQDPCSLNFDVGTNIRWERADETPDAKRTPAALADEQRSTPDERKRCDSPFAFWAGGNIDFGFLRPSSATDRSDFTTSGLTFGADTRVMPGLILGAAVGYGRDSTDVGTNASESHAQGLNATFYGSYEPLRSVYIDFLLGYGDLSFDATRWQGSTMMLGGRNGAQTFGSIGVSGIVDAGRFRIAPYGRFDHVRSRLDGYTESGLNTMALSYAEMTASEDVLAVGLFASYRFPMGRASLEPNLRFEARRARASSADQSLWYADLPMLTYVITDGTVSDTQLLGGLGLVLRVADELSIAFDYSYTGSSGTYRNESLRLLLRAPF